MLNAGAQVFGITLTILYGEILERFGDLAANASMCAFLLIGLILTGLIKSDLRRQNALKIEATNESRQVFKSPDINVISIETFPETKY